MEGKRAKHDTLGCEVEGTKYSVNLRTLIQAVTISKITAPYVELYAGSSNMGEVAIGALASVIIGGTVSELTGGKFANGAITAAYAYLFNQVLSQAEALQRQQARNKAIMDGHCVDGYVQRCSGVSDFAYTQEQTAAQRSIIRRATGEAANDVSFVIDTMARGAGPLAPKFVMASLGLKMYSTWAIPPSASATNLDIVGVVVSTFTMNKSPFVDSGATIFIEALKRTQEK